MLLSHELNDESSSPSISLSAVSVSHEDDPIDSSAFFLSIVSWTSCSCITFSLSSPSTSLSSANAFICSLINSSCIRLASSSCCFFLSLFLLPNTPPNTPLLISSFSPPLESRCCTGGDPMIWTVWAVPSEGNPSSCFSFGGCVPRSPSEIRVAWSPSRLVFFFLLSFLVICFCSILFFRCSLLSSFSIRRFSFCSRLAFFLSSSSNNRLVFTNSTFVTLVSFRWFLIISNSSRSSSRSSSFRYFFIRICNHWNSFLSSLFPAICLSVRSRLYTESSSSTMIFSTLSDWPSMIRRFSLVFLNKSSSSKSSSFSLLPSIRRSKR